MRSRRFFVFALTLFVVTSWVASAFAQEITVSRVTGNRTRGTPGTIGVSRQDCIDDISLTFSLGITGLTGTYDLQTWGGESGANCEDQNNRTGTTVSRCRQIAPSQRTTAATYQIPVRARDLAAATAPPPQPAAYETSGLEACDAQTTASARTVSVYFMIMNGSTVVKSTSFKATGAAATTTTTTTPQEGVVVDLKGPDAPSNVRVATGDRRLRVDFTPTGDRDVKGYVFYCQPSSQATPSDGGTTTRLVCPEAGTSTSADAGEDADPDAATTTETDAGCTEEQVASNGGSCPSPTISTATECGRIIQVGATSGNTDRKLINQTEYAVAVAALDAFDNVGPASEASACGAPEAVNDFWREYNSAGGDAGGFCALEAVGMPIGSNLASVGAAIALGLAVRRSRRKSR